MMTIYHFSHFPAFDSLQATVEQVGRRRCTIVMTTLIKGLGIERLKTKNKKTRNTCVFYALFLSGADASIFRALIRLEAA